MPQARVCGSSHHKALLKQKKKSLIVTLSAKYGEGWWIALCKLFCVVPQPNSLTLNPVGQNLSAAHSTEFLVLMNFKQMEMIVAKMTSVHLWCQGSIRDVFTVQYRPY